MKKIILLPIVLIAFALWAGEAPAQDASQICFYKCIEQNGESAKASCAMDCGLVGGGARGGGIDCGTAYKQCKKNCASSDKVCKEQCRAMRRNCK